MSEKEVFIFEVSSHSFDTAVIQNSHKLPVLVEFMGMWSGPCIQMADELAGLAKEFAGDFIFAKVDVDEQPELTAQYGIEDIPSLKVFVNGQVAETKPGVLGQNELRQLLKAFGVYSQSDEMRQQARQQHMAGDTVAAIQLLSEAMQKDPSNTKVALDMVQIFIDLNEVSQAKGLFAQMPDVAKQSDMGKSITGQLAFMDLAAKTSGKPHLQQLLATSPDNCDALFDLAVCLIAEKDYQQAANQLFEIMRIDPGYKDDAAREMIINVANMLATNNPALSSEFRSRLGSIGFS